MLSIKLLGVGIVLLSIFVTAAVCTALVLSSNADALDETKANRDASLGSCFAIGEESVRNRTAEYLDTLMGDTQVILEQFTKGHRLNIASIANEIMSEPWEVVKQWEWHRLTRYYNAFRLNWEDGNTGLFIILKNELMVIYGESPHTLDSPQSAYHQMIINYNYGSDHPWGGPHRSIRASVDSHGHPRGVTTPFDVAWNITSTNECTGDLESNGTHPDKPCNSTRYPHPTTGLLYTLGKFLDIKPGHTLWTPPLPVETWYLTLNTATSLHHDNQLSGIIGGGVDLRRFSTFLANLNIGGPVDGHPSRGRVFMTLRKTWVTIMKSSEGLLLAASHGSVLRQANPAVAPEPIRPEESSDLIIRAVVNQTSGLDMDELAAGGGLTTLNISTDYAPAGEAFYFRVGHLADEYGVDWLLHLVIDRAYILGSIDRRTAETLTEIHASERRVEDDLAGGRVVLYTSLVAVAVGLTVLSAVFVRVLLRPLSALKEEMKWVSAMDLDKVGASELSMMDEVREMQVAFRKMKRNLEDYRAYVPVALLGGELVPTVEPPTGDVALVFTDIVKSTELWDKSPAGMNIAIEAHNEIMRGALAFNSGYEVKTIGDAFMVAFSSPLDALQFCLKVQQDLAAQEWPAELGLDTQGLRVRIGCHVGHTIPEENPLTGRRDYRGPTVNKAARSEGKALPGTVCVTGELLVALEGSEVLEGAMVENIGKQPLKGIEGPQQLHLMVPCGLGERLACGTYRVLSNSSVGALDRSISIVSSGTSVMLDGQVSPKGATPGQVYSSGSQKKTGLTLVKGTGTVAVCMMVGSRRVFDDCNAMVRAALDAASQTDGVVGNVTGQTLTVVWNTSKPCRLHTTSAMRFATHLMGRAATTVRVGVATGLLMYGNVGAQKRRFNTAFGRPLEAAHAGAALAAHCKTFAVFADVTESGGNEAGTSPAVAPFVRLLDVWEDGMSGRVVKLYELLSTKLKQGMEDDWGVMSGVDPVLDAYNMAYEAALKGDQEALKKLRLSCALEERDAAMQHVLETLEGLPHDNERTSRVRVTFCNLPQGVVAEPRHQPGTGYA